MSHLIVLLANSVRESAKMRFSCFSLSAPIAKINNLQQFNLRALVISACIEVTNLIHEIELVVYLDKVVKLKVQPVL